MAERTKEQYEENCRVMADKLKDFLLSGADKISEAACTAHLLRQPNCQEHDSELMEAIVDWAIRVAASAMAFQSFLYGAFEVRLVNGKLQVLPIDDDDNKATQIMIDHGMLPAPRKKEDAKATDKKMGNEKG